MAYADTNTTTRKLGAGAAVLLIEGGLAAALIVGLATSYTVKSDRNPTAINVPLPKPSPPPPVDVQPVARDKKPSAIDRPDTLIKLPPIDAGPVTVVEIPVSGGAGTSAIGDAAFPDPTPSPTTTPPLFKPRAAAPKGKWQAWVSTNDYPTRDLREGNQGTTRYRLSIDAAGRVSECTVTASSGHPGLDRATCDKVRSRARFEPATDQTGARVPGSFAGSVTWQIPQD